MIGYATKHSACELKHRATTHHGFRSSCTRGAGVQPPSTSATLSLPTISTPSPVKLLDRASSNVSARTHQLPADTTDLAKPAVLAATTSPGAAARPQPAPGAATARTEQLQGSETADQDGLPDVSQKKNQGMSEVHVKIRSRLFQALVRQS